MKTETMCIRVLIYIYVIISLYSFKFSTKNVIVNLKYSVVKLNIFLAVKRYTVEFFKHADRK